MQWSEKSLPPKTKITLGRLTVRGTFELSNAFILSRDDGNEELIINDVYFIRRFWIDRIDN